MTLGGLALAVGILVDDATVEIENVHRNMGIKGKTLVRAILDGAQEIAVPAFVSTLCICIVFVPVLMLSGAARYLFTPLAMGVVFAIADVLSADAHGGTDAGSLSAAIGDGALSRGRASGRGLQICWCHLAYPPGLRPEIREIPGWLSPSARMGPRAPRPHRRSFHEFCAGVG
jgi:hypothetical protein